MAVGGQVQNPYLQQQQLYREPAPKAMGNPTMAMDEGGDTVPTVAQTQEQILQAAQDNKPYTTGSFLSGPSFLDSENKGQDNNPNAPTEQTQIKLWSPEGVGPTTYNSPSQDALIADLESKGYTRTDPNLNTTPTTKESSGDSTYNPFPDDEEDNSRVGRLQALDWSNQDSILEWGKEQSDTLLTKGLVGGAMATTAIANLRAGAIISRRKYGEDSSVALELDKLADAKEEDLGPMGRMLGKMFGMDGTKTAEKYFEAEGASVPASTTPPPSQKSNDPKPKKNNKNKTKIDRSNFPTIKNRTDSSGKKLGDKGYKSALRERQEAKQKASAAPFDKTGGKLGFKGGIGIKEGGLMSKGKNK